MATRREVIVGISSGLAGLAVAAGRSMAQSPASESDALDVLNPWADALFSGDPGQVEKVLAPEYQILRSMGPAMTNQATFGHCQFRRLGRSSATL
jgi:hypothetical protein